MTQKQAYSQLPADAKWSCCFGLPGNGGFSERFKTPDGKRYEISNGTFGDEWTFKELPQ